MKYMKYINILYKNNKHIYIYNSENRVINIYLLVISNKNNNIKEVISDAISYLENFKFIKLTPMLI